MFNFLLSDATKLHPGEDLERTGAVFYLIARFADYILNLCLPPN